MWSPAIQPVAERLLGQLPLAGTERVIDVGTGAGALLPAICGAAPHATVVGIDNAEGMLRLARRRHSGPLQLMDAEKLDFPDAHFDAALVAFVLFHLPHPERCLGEVFRVLNPEGSVGTATWGEERFPAADRIWDEELTRSGALPLPVPVTENRRCCNTEANMVGLLGNVGFAAVRTWSEHLVHQWSAAAHYEHRVLDAMHARLLLLASDERDRCLERIRERLAAAAEEDYVYRGDVILAAAQRPTPL